MLELVVLPAWDWQALTSCWMIACVCPLSGVTVSAVALDETAQRIRVMQGAKTIFMVNPTAASVRWSYDAGTFTD